MMPLKGADGQTYAVAQGNLLVSGFGADGADGSSVTVNVPSAGRIPNGATVERGVVSPFNHDASLVMNLHAADFTTAFRVATSINESLGEGWPGLSMAALWKFVHHWTRQKKWLLFQCWKICR